ncbi:GNAT family N-acetyltransferase [Virgibacillus oceani]
MNISILKADTKHTKGIARICSVGWRQTVTRELSEEYQKKNADFWYNHDRVYDDIRAGMYSYVALQKQDVVGVIGGGITEVGAGEVFVFYVDETYRYKGIGRLLLEELTEEHKYLGIKKQWVSVQEDNHRGIPFYEARGFVFQHKRISYTETNEAQVSLRYLRKI